MGKMKEFAFRISEYVNGLGLSEEVIVAAFTPRQNHGNSEESRWLREQIRAVQANPQLYRGLVESSVSLTGREKSA